MAGVPEVTLSLSAPAAEQAQSTGPAGQLVLYAKLYDVAPDGSRSLVNGLISPFRVADVTQPVRVELPGIVHRYDVGHRLELVLAAGDSAYHGNVLADTVTVADDPAAPASLILPLAAAGPDDPGSARGAGRAPAAPGGWRSGGCRAVRAPSSCVSCGLGQGASSAGRED